MEVYFAAVDLFMVLAMFNDQIATLQIIGDMLNDHVAILEVLGECNYV